MSLGLGLTLYNSGLVLSAGGGAPFANTKSLSFDGVDDYVSMPRPLDYGDAYTIVLWAKYNATPSLSNIFNINDGANNIAQAYFWTLDNGIIFKSGNGSHFRLSSDPDITLWHCYVFTYNGSSTTQIYVDGVLNVSSTVNSLGNANVDAMEISRGLSGGYQSNMNADEVSVYDRVLTPTEITSISSAPTDLTSLNPVAWYRFEEGSGTTAIDSGSGGNNGTLINGVVYSTDVP